MGQGTALNSLRESPGFCRKSHGDKRPPFTATKYSNPVTQGIRQQLLVGITISDVRILISGGDFNQMLIFAKFILEYIKKIEEL